MRDGPRDSHGSPTGREVWAGKHSTCGLEDHKLDWRCATMETNYTDITITAAGTRAAAAIL